MNARIMRMQAEIVGLGVRVYTTLTSRHDPIRCVAVFVRKQVPSLPLRSGTLPTRIFTSRTDSGSELPIRAPSDPAYPLLDVGKDGASFPRPPLPPGCR